MFENKDIIHIASEVVVLLGVVFYFSSKNKKLLDDMNALSDRVEEQEKQIQNLKAALGHISGLLNNARSNQPTIDNSRRRQIPAKKRNARTVSQSENDRRKMIEQEIESEFEDDALKDEDLSDEEDE